MKSSKHLRKFTAIALTFCLVFTMAVPSFAATGPGLFSKEKAPEPTMTFNEKASGKALNYVSFGDSQTNGYYLDGFFFRGPDGKLLRKSDGNYVNTQGFNTYVKGTYTDIFSQHLAKITGKQVNLYQYASNAMRCEDLHKLLDSSAPTDDFYRQWFDGSPRYKGDAPYEGSYEYWNRFYLDENYEGIGSYEMVSKNVRLAAKNADVISIGLGINSFGNFFALRALDVILGEFDKTYGKIDRTRYLNLNKVEKALFDSAYDTVMKKVKTIVGEENAVTLNKLEALIWDAVYAYTGFATGFTSCLEDIEKLNPDATIIAVGISNAAADTKILLNGSTINVGLIAGVLIDVANLYMISACKKSDLDTIYVDPGNFDKMIKDIAGLSADEVDFSSVIEMLVDSNVLNALDNYGKAFLGDEIYGAMVTEAVDDESGETVTALREDEIQASVNAILAGETPADDIGYIFLGIRDAITWAAKNTGTIDFANAFGAYANPENIAGDLKAYYEGLPDTMSLREKVCDTFLNGAPGISDCLYICARVLVHTAGSHINYDGHAALAEKICNAYDKHVVLNKTKTLITKGIPIVVGGTAVTFVTREVGGQILSAVIAAKIIKASKKVFRNNTETTLLRTLRFLASL